MNAKLDSIIMALNDADNRLVDIEMKPESVAKALFDELQARGTHLAEVPDD